MPGMRSKSIAARVGRIIPEQTLAQGLHQCGRSLSGIESSQAWRCLGGRDRDASSSSLRRASCSFVSAGAARHASLIPLMGLRTRACQNLTTSMSGFRGGLRPIERNEVEILTRRRNTMITLSPVHTARQVTCTAAVAAIAARRPGDARECGDHAGIRNRRVQHRVSTAGRESTRRSRGLPSNRSHRESGRLLVHVRLLIEVQPERHVS